MIWKRRLFSKTPATSPLFADDSAGRAWSPGRHVPLHGRLPDDVKSELCWRSRQEWRKPVPQWLSGLSSNRRSTRTPTPDHSPPGRQNPSSSHLLAGWRPPPFRLALSPPSVILPPVPEFKEYPEPEFPSDKTKAVFDACLDWYPADSILNRVAGEEWNPKVIATRSTVAAVNFSTPVDLFHGHIRGNAPSTVNRTA